jgi:hypothetical protein
MSKPTHDQLLAQITKLQADNAALAARPANKISLKIGEKGALSVYGLQRFPVTLYAEQWERLLGEVPMIKKYMIDNAGKLTRKAR